VTSPAKVAANRQNARRSTGPRTAAGQMRSRMNALTHGLAATAAVDVDPALSLEIRELVEGIGAAYAVSGSLREAVGQIAEAEIHVRRVRRAKLALVQQALERELQACATSTESWEGSRHVDNILARAVLGIAPALARIDRYERRALSRRKKALQALRSYLF
jgi:hypothetical protein